MDFTALQALLQELRKGPPKAVVQDVSVSWDPVQGNFRTFEVRK